MSADGDPPDGPVDPGHPRGVRSSDAAMPDWRTRARVAKYQTLRSLVDEDSLHDVIATNGIEILDAEIPYLLVAARNRLRRSWRATSRAAERLDLAVDVERPQSMFDPADAILRNEAAADLLRAISTLREEDQHVLWWSAAGMSTEEMVSRWAEAGLDAPAPSAQALRQRLHRARRRVVAALASERRPGS